MCQAEEFKLFSVGSIVRWPGQSWDSSGLLPLVAVWTLD